MRCKDLPQIYGFVVVVVGGGVIFPLQQHWGAPSIPEAFTYVIRDQEVPAQVLVIREAPCLSVPIHVGNVLLYSLIVEPEPHPIIIADLQGENKRECTHPPAVTPLAGPSDRPQGCR